MKKLISFIVLIALSISLFGCAKAPIDSASPDLLVENNVQDPAPVTDEPQPQQTPDEQQEPLDKAPPCDVTIDEPFSDFEVVVSFTLEESAKDKEYTPSDFAAVDCFNVYPFDYYPEEIHPEYAGRKTVILMLGKQSKQGVLDAVEALQKDDRIYFAEPNFSIATPQKTIVFYLSLYQFENLEDFRNMFDMSGIKSISTLNLQEYTAINHSINEPVYKVCCESFDIDLLKAFSKNDKVKRVIYSYRSPDSFEKLSVVMHTDESYTSADFEGIKGIKAFKNVGDNVYDVTLEKHDSRSLATVYFAFLNDERVKYVDLTYKTSGYVVQT